MAEIARDSLLVLVSAPSGGGKTTLFHLLATLMPLAEGQVELLGYDLRRAARAIRPHLGVVFQHPSLDRKLTVYENLRQIVRHLDQATILEQRKPKTVSELFGLANGHIPLESADGEDYSKLDLMEGKIAILTITTKPGIMVTFQRKN